MQENTDQNNSEYGHRILKSILVNAINWYNNYDTEQEGITIINLVPVQQTRVLKFSL